MKLPHAVLIIVLLVAALGGGWWYFENQRSQQNQRVTRLNFLEQQGTILLENRRWGEAAEVFQEIETLAPGSLTARDGRREIESGKAEEQTQLIGYWTGQAAAELEAGRLDEATAAAQEILRRIPGNNDAARLLDQISAARAHQSHAAKVAASRVHLEQRDWNAAIASASEILRSTPGDPDATAILADATAALQQAYSDKAEAAGLMKLALARDNGNFDQQALDWARQASTLAPEDQEIAALFEKLSSHTRTIRVPGDFETPAEAIASARDRDRVVIAAAIWKGPLIINTAIELQGAGHGETIIECVADSSSAITIGPHAGGARITGITFRHELPLTLGTDRFSVALVRGGTAIFSDCHFTQASGHGLAVIEGGTATATRCRFADNGWNGIAAIGSGTTLLASQCESVGNFEHGIESWDGAAATLVSNRCVGNTRNGIHADNGTAAATIEENQLIENREFGLVIDSAGSGRITGNTARGNLLGGFVVRAAAATLPFKANQATQNEGPGLTLEKGISPAAYADNSMTGNRGQQLLTDVNLTVTEDPPPEKPADPPRATIVTDPEAE